MLSKQFFANWASSSGSQTEDAPFITSLFHRCIAIDSLSHLVVYVSASNLCWGPFGVVFVSSPQRGEFLHLCATNLRVWRLVVFSDLMCIITDCTGALYHLSWLSNKRHSFHCQVSIKFHYEFNSLLIATPEFRILVFETLDPRPLFHIEELVALAVGSFACLFNIPFGPLKFCAICMWSFRRWVAESLLYFDTCLWTLLSISVSLQKFLILWDLYYFLLLVFFSKFDSLVKQRRLPCNVRVTPFCILTFPFCTACPGFRL